MFAVAPLVIVVAELAGLVVGHHQAVLNELYRYLKLTAGPSAAHGVQAVVVATFSQRRAGLLAEIIGWAVFVLAAMGLFGALQDALNTVWDVVPKKKRILEMIRSRLLSFGMVLCLAFVLLVSLGLNTIMTVAAAAAARISPALPAVLEGVDFVASLALVVIVFSLIYRYLPEQRIAWRDVWIGAIASAILFVGGQFLLGWYLGRVGLSSTFGSFGDIVVFLLWAFYSAQILLLGAEFTHLYATSGAAERSRSSATRV
jgi:membrane protein